MFPLFNVGDIVAGALGKPYRGLSISRNRRCLTETERTTDLPALQLVEVGFYRVKYKNTH